MTLKTNCIEAVALLVALVVTFSVVGVGGIGVASTQENLDITVDVPQEATVGEQTTLSAAISIPDLPRDHENDLTVMFYSDGRQIGSETVTVADGETTKVDLSHTFNSAGDKEIQVEASTTLGGQEFTGTDTTTLSVVEAEEQISIDGDLSLSLETPDSPEVDEETTTTVQSDIPSLTGAQSGELTLRLLVDGEETASKTVTVSGGELTKTDFTTVFDNSGETTVTVEAVLTVADRSVSKTVSRTVDVSEAQEQISIDGNLFLNVDVPDSPEVDEEITTTVESEIPGLTGAQEGELTIRLLVDGEETVSKTITVTGEETTETDFTTVFENSGETTVTVEAILTVGDQSVTESVSRTVDVSEAPLESTSVEGAAFAVPESLEDEVEDYRNDAPQELDAQAFVLATEDELYVVFTQREPTKGVASVEGPVLERELATENLTYGVIAATSTSFETTGTEVSVQEVADNSEQYRLDLVRINAHYRRVSTLTDPDEGEDFNLSTTSGVLVENPRTAVSLFQNVGNNTRALSQNTSTDQIDTILNDPRGPHLHTFSFETEFWTDAEATVDAIVLDPQSTAQQFIDEYDQAGGAHAEDGEPILYVVEDDFQPQEMDNVASIKSQADSLDGEVVKTEVRLYQEKISVQETLEHNTGCNEDLLEIQTPEGPVCVNVVQDNLLHGGIAWNSIPQSREDALLVMGVSSRHQDTPEEFEEGRYRLKGEVVSTSRLNESLPDGSVLVIYNMTWVSDIDYEAVAQEARSLIETRTDELATRLRQQVGEDGIEIATERTSGTIQSATPGEPATVTFSWTSRGSVSVQQARINVLTQVQNARVDVAKVASLPSGVSQPPRQSLRILNISSSLADSDINNASFQLRISTAAIPDGEDVTVSRYHDGKWNTLNTTVVEETNTEIVVNVRTPGFSYFAVSTQSVDSDSSTDEQDENSDSSTDEQDGTPTNEGQQSDGETQTADTDGTDDTQSGTGDETETSGEGGPGFTIISALIAALLFVGWQVRR